MSANVSIHKSTLNMYERTKSDGLSTVFDRYVKQQPQCGFGLNGVCCTLCSHGPCRVSPLERGPKAGICGADADTIVARNLLRLAVHGASAYSHHLEEVVRTLNAAASGKSIFSIQDEGKLRQLVSDLGLDGSGSKEQAAVRLAEVAVEDLRRGSDEPSLMVEKLAPESRKRVWRDLGVLPGGLHSEIRDALTKSMTSIDTDPVDLLLTCVRLAIAAGFQGLMGTILLQDVLLGTPAPVESRADLGIVDPAAVNIVAHGHVPLMGTAVIAASKSPALLKSARQAGAVGINVYGSMCTGQELMQRAASSAAGFVGQTGNWINQEFLVATGAVDLVLMDMNCSIPGLKKVADHYGTKLVSVSKIVRMPGVSDHVDFDPERAGEQAESLEKMAIEQFKKRKASNMAVRVPSYAARALAGFSVESIVKALGGSLEPLLKAIQNSQIKGIAAVVGCTNNRNGHDTTSVALTRELIKRDILVINAGCVSSAVQIEGLMDPASAAQAGAGLRGLCEALGIPPCLNFGSCVDIGRIGLAVAGIAAALGVDPSALPVAASAPEYLEQKAVADGVFAVAMGILTHLGPVPPITGSRLVTEILGDEVQKLVGGRFLVELDPVRAADAIEQHILEKRSGLNMEWEPARLAEAGA